ncbi:MAG TPA: phosphate acyltransferase, partial [Gammaproteobacteria bacterium]|nr:phosphate acyltransferase [Gammaproteobacteria bacterium]
MNSRVTIALDAMGGDVGFDVVVPAARLALDKHPDADFILVGDSDTLQQALQKAGCAD